MKKKTLIRLIAALLCLATVFLAGCSSAPKTEGSAETASQAAPGEPKYRDTIRVSTGSVTHLNPYDSDTAAHNMVFWCTHDRLVELDFNTYKAVPGLAESWEWIDDTTMEFKLREGVKFHNGEVFTSDDAVWSFEQSLAGSSASKLSFIDHVEAPDAQTFRIYMTKHYIDAEMILAQGYCSITNRKACQEDEQYGTKIGTGPFKVEAFTEAEKVVMVRNDDYWGEKPKTRCFEFVHMPESTTSQIALENGEVDFSNFDLESEDVINENPNLTTRIVESGQLYSLCFNSSKYATADRNTRLAVAYAIDLDAIRMAFDKGRSTQYGAAWGRYTLGFDENVPFYGRDLDKAKEYLAKAFPDGNAKLVISNSGGAGGTIAEIIQANCAEIGLEIEIETMESAALTAKTKYNVAEHQMMPHNLGWNPWGDDASRVYLPGSNINKAVIDDPRITELLDKASTEPDEAKRIEYYHEIQKINHEECYILPLFCVLNTDAYTTGLEGVMWDNGARHKWAYAYILEAE